MENKGQISDGYHTFDELYAHRDSLFCVFLQYRSYVMKTRLDDDDTWKSKFNADGSYYEGYFVAGCGKPGETQISYHLKMEYWDRLKGIQEVPLCPWDGHSSNDVLSRLKKF